MALAVIGIGAAGNKAAAKLIECKVLSKNNVTLLNTNLLDVPAGYKDIAVQFSAITSLGGSDKRPEISKQSILAAIKNDKINIAELAKFESPTAVDNAVVLVTSTEGGTGSGATNTIAKYFLAMGYPVHIFGFIGFNDDATSIQNTLKFFRGVDNNTILHIIKNTEFLDYTKNYINAEQLANDEFVKQISILKGDMLIPSVQNIDSADLFGATTVPNYMDIQEISLDGVKSVETFNEAIKNAYEHNKGFNFEPTAKKLAVIINAEESTINNIDFSFEMIRRYTADPICKIYRHVQYDGNQPEVIQIIASGINYPEKEIKSLINLSKKMKDKEVVMSKSMLDMIDEDDIDEVAFTFDVMPKKIVNPANIKDIFMDSITKQAPEDDDSDF